MATLEPQTVLREGVHALRTRWNGLQLKLPQQRWRRWAGAGLLGLIVVTAGSVVFRKRSIEAYVTADVVTITSPVEGVVTSQAVTAGQQFKAGETVLVIQANRGDAANLEISTQKLKQTQIELQATSAELKRYQQINQSRLKAEVASAERSLKDLQAQQSRYASQADRYRALVKNGAMDADTLVGAEAMASSLAQRVGNQRQQLSNLKQELKSAQATAPDRTAVFGGSARRMEIMEVELLRLISRRKELEVQEAQLKKEVDQAQKRSRFVYQPRFPGLLLTERVSVGDEVNDGTTLLTAVNCDKLRVEALFEASKLKDVHLGQMVKIDWPNSQRSSQGRVVSLRGEQGVNGLETSGVAKFRPAHTDRTRAMISLQPNDLQEQNCRLGERVRVDL